MYTKSIIVALMLGTITCTHASDKKRLKKLNKEIEKLDKTLGKLINKNPKAEATKQILDIYFELAEKIKEKEELENKQ